MSDTWGKGSVNNNIGWGQAAGSATNDWGKSQKESWAGQTDIVGVASVSITYSSSAFCSDASDPTPTISNNAGAGTFSSTAGLVFISTTTGEVDLDASTAGATYLITYTDTDAATATFSLTINDLDNAAFAYSASSYEPTDADPTPTITGLTGGTFSGTTGLVINSTTGEIDLSASTVASHTITYDTTSSGSSVCPNTSTQTVEIALAGIANNYSMNFDGTDDYIDVGTLDFLNASATDFTISLWVKPTLRNYGMPFSTSTKAHKSIYIYYAQSGSRNRFEYAIRGSGNQNTVSPVTDLNDVPPNVWHHVILTSEGTTAKFYLNGSLLHTGTSGTSYSESGDSVKIGKFLAASYEFTGNIDEVAVWNTALTSTQVSEIYNATDTNLTKDLTTVSGSNLKYWNRMGD